MARGAEVLVAGVAQEKEEIIRTRIWAFPLRLVVVKVMAVCPLTLLPLTLHWYWGLLPPLVGLAVKVMLSPWQILVVGEETETEAARLETRETV